MGDIHHSGPTMFKLIILAVVFVAATEVAAGILVSHWPLPGCSPMMCLKYCPNGFQRDANGCYLCKCRERPLIIEPRSSLPGCSPMVCLMKCRNGFERDARGCYLCKCREERSIIEPRIPFYPICAMYCPFGFVKGPNGRPICKCAKKPVYTKISKKSIQC